MSERGAEGGLKQIKPYTVYIVQGTFEILYLKFMNDFFKILAGVKYVFRQSFKIQMGIF